MNAPYETTHTLTLTQGMTISSALTAYALSLDSSDARIRDVISALRAVGYSDTADVLFRLQHESHSVRVPDEDS